MIVMFLAFATLVPFTLGTDVFVATSRPEGARTNLETVCAAGFRLHMIVPSLDFEHPPCLATIQTRARL